MTASIVETTNSLYVKLGITDIVRKPYNILELKNILLKYIIEIYY